MTEINQVGGARVGFAHASWPFARLIVTADKLEVNAAILGSFVFKPSDVASIEIASGSLFSSGIKINHSVVNYSRNIVFIPRSDAAGLINKIAQTGFLSGSASPSPYLEAEIEKKQVAGGFPVKISAVIAIVVIWNLLCLPDILKTFGNKNPTPSFGPGIQAALAFMFLTGLALLVSQPFQDLILKPGHNVRGLKPFIYFTMFMTGLMFALSFIIPG